MDDFDHFYYFDNYFFIKNEIVCNVLTSTVLYHRLIIKVMPPQIIINV